MTTITYDQLMNQVFTKIAPKYDELSEDFINDVKNCYHNPAVSKLFDSFYDQTMTTDDDDFFEGYIDEETGENTRTYDMEWVENQFEDDESWHDYYSDLCENLLQ